MKSSQTTKKGAVKRSREETPAEQPEICSPPLRKSKLWQYRGVKKADSTVKSAALCPFSPFSQASPGTLFRVEQKLNESFTQIENDRSVSEVKDEFTSEGAPTAIYTPGKTELLLKHDYGVLCIYSNEENLSEEMGCPSLMEVDLEQKKQIENSAAYQQVKLNQHPIKKQEMLVTLEQIERVEQELKTSGYRRKCTQVQVMKGSATQYGRQYFPGKKLFEWLHLIMYRLKGAKSQQEANLICGAKFANSDMMFVEFQHKKLARAYPEGYQLQVFAETVKGIDGSQMGTCIEYIIRTPHFILPFKFDPQTRINPKLFNLDYVEGLIVAALEMKQKSSYPIASPEKMKKRTFFFARRKLNLDNAGKEFKLPASALKSF